MYSTARGRPDSFTSFAFFSSTLQRCLPNIVLGLLILHKTGPTAERGKFLYCLIAVQFSTLIIIKFVLRVFDDGCINCYLSLEKSLSLHLPLVYILSGTLIPSSSFERFNPLDFQQLPIVRRMSRSIRRSIHYN